MCSHLRSEACELVSRKRCSLTGAAVAEQVISGLGADEKVAAPGIAAGKVSSYRDTSFVLRGFGAGRTARPGRDRDPVRPGGWRWGKGRRPTYGC